MSEFPIQRFGKRFYLSLNGEKVGKALNVAQKERLASFGDDIQRIMEEIQTPEYQNGYRPLKIITNEKMLDDIKENEASVGSVALEQGVATILSQVTLNELAYGRTILDDAINDRDDTRIVIGDDVVPNALVLECLGRLKDRYAADRNLLTVDEYVTIFRIVIIVSGNGRGGPYDSGAWYNADGKAKGILAKYAKFYVGYINGAPLPMKATMVHKLFYGYCDATFSTVLNKSYTQYLVELTVTSPYNPTGVPADTTGGELAQTMAEIQGQVKNLPKTNDGVNLSLDSKLGNLKLVTGGALPPPYILNGVPNPMGGAVYETPLIGVPTPKRFSGAVWKPIVQPGAGFEEMAIKAIPFATALLKPLVERKFNQGPRLMKKPGAGVFSPAVLKTLEEIPGLKKN